MSTIALIGAFIQLILKILDWWLEKDAAKKKAKQEALSEIQQGIKDRDPSAVTAGFDKYNRL